MRIILSCFFILVLSQAFVQIKIEGTHHWIGELQMNDRLTVPFDFYFQTDKEGFTIRNGQEWIHLKTKTKKDSTVAYFKEFDARLVFKQSENNLRGYWINFNKTQPVRIPFNAQKSISNKFNCNSLEEDPINLKERYRVLFEKSNTHSVGKFSIVGDQINGTFLTETGDYRFLSGCSNGQSFRLSSFNGSWAMLFEGEVQGDSIHGYFYSGSTFSTPLKGKADNNYTLRNPEELTKVVNDRPFSLSEIRTLKKGKYDLVRNENKVIIYQIMGTWCPNCIDESKYYNTLYKKYKKQGLEIHALAYEVARPSLTANIKHLRRFKKRMKISYPLFYAGKASKEVASSHFPMLNEIMSFPTSIVVGRKGTIEYIHTGFNGPATGAEYNEFVLHMDELIEKLLDE